MTREEAIEILEETGFIAHSMTDVDTALDMAIEALKREHPDEWCYECKEYDTEKKCCPRFNRVIRGTMNDMAKRRTWSHTYDNACMDGERSEEE